MSLTRRYLALDLRPTELRAVALHGRAGRAQLEGARLVALPVGAIVPSLREPNIRDVARVVEALRDLLHPLAGSEERLALVLPETAGRVLVAEVDAPFRSHAEGEQILKWQLKGSLPADAAEVVLDFQLLDRRENGGVRLLVAAMARRVLEQYQEVVLAAGYHALQVGFHSLYLHNYYRTRIERPEESTLVVIESGMLSLQYCQNHVPVYHRFRETGVEPAAIFQELSRALVGAHEQHPGLRRAEVFVQCDWAEPAAFLEVLRGVFQREVTLLEPRLERIAVSPPALPEWRLRGLAAAAGAAEQLM